MMKFIHTATITWKKGNKNVQSSKSEGQIASFSRSGENPEKAKGKHSNTLVCTYVNKYVIDENWAENSWRQMERSIYESLDSNSYAATF